MLRGCVTLVDGSTLTTEKILVPRFDSQEFKNWFTDGISKPDFQEPKLIKYMENGEEVTMNPTLREDEAEMSTKPGETDTTMALFDKETATWKVIDLTAVTYAQYVHGALTFNLEEF